MVLYDDCLNQVRAENNFTSAGQKVGNAAKGIWNAITWTYAKGKKIHAVVSPAINEVVERNKVRNAEGEAAIKARKEFSDIRHSAGQGLVDAVNTVQSAEARGWNVRIEDAPDVKLENYGQFLELYKNVLAGTVQTREAVYLVDTAQRTAYKY
jgi:hypothetical protein